jgi:Uma2 family endonuclease
MATTTQVPLEVYLRSFHYEPDAEYIDGEVRERPAGEDDHSAWQVAICAWFLKHTSQWNIRVRPELRVQVKPTRFLIPDVSILNAANPKERFATLPPLAVFEVWSPENTLREMIRKFDDYEQMGIPQIWFLDPKDAIWQRYSNGKLADSERFSEPSMGIEFDMSEIAKLLQ